MTTALVHDKNLPRRVSYKPRKKSEMRERLVWVATLSLGMALLVGLYLKPPEKASDWASWASAGGTAAAVFAAVWATFSTENRHHQDALSAALITSIPISSTLFEAIAVLEAIEGRLENININGTSLEAMAEYVQQVEQVPFPTEEQLQRLVHAPGGMAVEIANVRARLRYATREVNSEELRRLGLTEHAMTKAGAEKLRPRVNSARTALIKVFGDIAEFRAKIRAQRA